MPRTEAQIAAEKARDEKWVNVQFRVTAAEYRILKRLAGKRPVSGWVRTTLRKHIGMPEDA